VTVKGARCNNLKNITVDFPLGKFIAVTGVSGSGKSSLVSQTLNRAIEKRLNGIDNFPGEHDDIFGLENMIRSSIFARAHRPHTQEQSGDLYESI
jgi:excinuclease ABC subunit A